MEKVKRLFRLDELSRKDMGQPETLLSLIRNQQVRGSNPRAGYKE